MSALENKKTSFKSGLRQIKAYFQTQKWKEALIFFAFILLALGFWMMQSLQQEYEMEVSIPIIYKNVPVDIAFTEPPLARVTIKLRDKGTVLMNYSFGRKFSPIEINMKTENPLSESGLIEITRREIESNILKQIISTTNLVDIIPDHIAVRFGKLETKEVPVIFDGNIVTEPGFQIAGDIVINPATINIFAAKSTLDTIQSIKTIFTEFRKVNKNIEESSVKLWRTDGVTNDPEFVTISVPVEEYIEKTLEIPISCTNIPANFTVRILPPTIKVVCNIPMSRFRNLTEDMFTVEIPFSVLEDNLTGIHTIELTTQPDWVVNPSLSPKQIEFIIEQNRTDD